MAQSHTDIRLLRSQESGLRGKPQKGSLRSGRNGSGMMLYKPNKSFQRTQAAFVTRLARCEKPQASRPPNAGAAELFR